MSDAFSELQARLTTTQAVNDKAAAESKAEIERLTGLLEELPNQPPVDIIHECGHECRPQIENFGGFTLIDPDTLAMYEKAYGQWTRFKPYLKRIKGHVNQMLTAYNKDVDQYNEAVKKGIKPRKWAGQQTPVTRIHLFK